MSSVRERYGEVFWRAHHEAWFQGELNQREYCEAYGIPLKAFGNWRARFKAEPQLPARKVLYRRGGLSHALSHGLSHGLSHDLHPTIPPAREGRRRKFSEADKRQILEQAMLPDACFAEVARRYGIALKPTALATSVGRRQLREQFCASLALARFYKTSIRCRHMHDDR